MQRPVWTGQNSDAPQDGYGYGTTIQHYAGHRMVGHSGGYPGHITRTMWDPNEGLASSVLTNAVDGPAEELAVGILKILDKGREVSSTARRFHHPKHRRPRSIPPASPVASPPSGA